MVYSINQEQVVWRVIEDEAALVHTESTYYYGLNPTGTFIWNLLADHDATFDQIVAAVSAEYDVEPAAVTADVSQLLEQLKLEQLIVER